ncbi:unnamed protein product [Psylliodes chrysocephalus]|uniref:Ubiquitin-related modifier 1 homolog n=1 Tax=Psylliodes chrysocephalus TaxID=3402493 RepID=A0A9P0CKU6_9CUCU|nr:unnamed protein product [Psylliodes chrysocephala]
MKITIQFGGGVHLLFGNIKLHEIDLPDREKHWTIGDLLLWMTDNLLQERPELFLQDKSVRPGILVIVNDTDWELLGCADYVIQPKDTIGFISTLHGG